MDPSRRGLLGAGVYSAALGVPEWPDDAGRLEKVRTGGTQRYGRADVDLVRRLTEHVSDLDNMYGGRHTRPMAASILVHTVAPYLRADAADETRRAMLSAAADLCYLSGFMAVDEGLHGLAQRYYTKALDLSRLVGDELMHSRVLRQMSLQAVGLGHHADALRFAEAAISSAPQAGPRMRAFLAGQVAHCRAVTGDRGGAVSALKDSERCLDLAENKEECAAPGGATSSDSGMRLQYSASSLTLQAAEVHYALGDIDGSLRSLKESARLRHRVSRRRNRVRYSSLLAERQLRRGHLEEACRTWSEVLDDYPLVQSASADEAVRTLLSLLRPHQRNRVAGVTYQRARALVRSRPLTV